METALSPEQFLVPLAAVLAGNAMTVGFIYCMWRLRRDESDWRAIAGALSILAFSAATFLVVRS